MPDFSGRILFLEDVSEAPYRVDRMLTTLKLMGALDGIAGFIFGECTDCDPGDGYGSLTLDQIFDDHIRSEEHKSELQSLMRNTNAVFCLHNKKINKTTRE